MPENYRDFKKPFNLRSGDLISNGEMVREIKDFSKDFYFVGPKGESGELLKWHKNEIEPWLQLISNHTIDDKAKALEKSRSI